MPEDSYLHKGLRRKLIKILRDKGINDDAVLEAINRVPRHIFLDNAFLEHAYQDKAFPIGDGQTISQPYTVASQTSLLKLEPGMKVLEIGTGSGYQCSVLLEMGVNVFTIEYHKSLFEKSKQMLHSLGYKAQFFCGDGSEGLARFGPYDRILATAGAPYVPQKLIEQLKVGGILVIPVGDQKNQKMLRLTKVSEKEITQEECGDFRFVPLVGKDGWNAKTNKI
ncbi:MAG TPA: protein-L-isoaspartate(D-aspartate) O-methyltransferase [Cytophaga sp.]|jgi:protein-L-isoaspartate(D-aspartate) O-methyltransferase|nr:protein-L-isoaspartate(D-aspartate) O-methyltransferase [Cytophaga sp.]